MKKSILALLFILIIDVGIVFSQCSIDYSQYVPVLNEEFDTYSGQVSNLLGPSSPWRATYTNEPSWGKGVEYYVPSQVQLIPDDNGGHRLLLVAEKLPSPIAVQKCDPNNTRSDITYKSGMLTLKEDFAGDPVTSSCQYNPQTGNACTQIPRGFSYGMFEIRCKMPHTGNIDQAGDYLWDAWPTFWTINQVAEMDIIDNITPDSRDYWNSGVIDWRGLPWHSNNTDWVQVPYNPLDQQYKIGNFYNIGDRVQPDDPVNNLNPWKVSFEAVNDILSHSCGMASYAHLRNLAAEFHTYTAVWTPQKVTFFFDGIEVYTIPATRLNLADCPANIITALQVFGGANGLSTGTTINWEIDYIKVYKPQGPQGNGMNLTTNDYITTPFKSDDAFINYNTMGDIQSYINTTNIIKVKTGPRSIAFNNQDPTQVFYAGEDGHLYDVIDNNGDQKWPTLEKVGLGHAPNFPNELIDGDLIFDKKSSKFLFKGVDNRIQYYLYGSSGWAHGYVDNNWGTIDYLVDDNEVGSTMAVSSIDGTIYYKGKDSKVQYFTNGQGSAHGWLSHTYSPNEYIKNDLILEDLGGYTSVIYKGNDDRLQIFWVDISQNPAPHLHGYIDNSGIPDWKVKSAPGSITLGELGEVFYIGADNRIQRYYSTPSGWVHEDLASSAGYTYNSVGYPNGDYALRGITYDKVNRRVLYLGNDGRIQYFGLYNGNWYHNYRDNYWSTRGYCSFTDQNTSDNPSIIHDEVSDRTYYIGDYSYSGSYNYNNSFGPANNALYAYDHTRNLRYFIYESCEYVPPCDNPDANISLRRPEVSTIINSYDTNELLVYPNPSNSGMFNVKTVLAGNNYAEVLDIRGKVIYKNTSLTAASRIDISDQPNGIYILIVKTDKGLYRQRLIVNK